MRGKKLAKDERTLKIADFNFLCLILPVVIAVLGLIGAIVLTMIGSMYEIKYLYFGWLLWVVFCVYPLYRKIRIFNSNKLQVTNRRLTGVSGRLETKTVDIPLDQISGIYISVTFWGKVFNYYNIHFNSSGLNSIVFSGVSNAFAFRNAVLEAIETHHEEERIALAKSIAEEISKNS